MYKCVKFRVEFPVRGESANEFKTFSTASTLINYTEFIVVKLRACEQIRT